MKTAFRRIAAIIMVVAVMLPAMSFSFAAESAAAIDLNINKITIGVGQKVKTVKPGTSAPVTWSSADESIATVNAKGQIKGIKKGTTTVTVSTGSDSADVTVVVVKKGKGVEKISLPKAASVVRGKSVTLKPSFTPAKPKDKTIVWTSSDESVATVENGKVTGVKPGKVTITAMASSGKTAKTTITVKPVMVKKITLSGSEKMISGETQQLSASIKPANADVQSIKWKSSNAKVAAVDQTGLVTALKPGTTKITATSQDGGKIKAFLTIKVRQEKFPYSLRYEIANGEVTVTGFHGSEKKLKIPAMIDGYPVTRIGKAFAYQNTNLEEVIIPEGVTVIEEEAFFQCRNLVTVDLPETLKEIHGSVFYECKSLKNISLPSGLTNLSARAFQYCAALEYIEIPAGISTIKFYSFLGCESLKKVKLNEGLLEIHLAAFTDCDSLETIEFPDSLHRIEREVMFGCDRLKTVEIPEGIEGIDELTFAHCLNLEKVVIPRSVYGIAFCAFVNYDTFEPLPKLTIYGYPGTIAEDYAHAYGFPFVMLSE